MKRYLVLFKGRACCQYRWRGDLRLRRTLGRWSPDATRFTDFKQARRAIHRDLRGRKAMGQPTRCYQVLAVEVAA